MPREAWRYYIRSYRGSYGRLVVAVAVSIAHSLLVFPLVLLVKYVFDTVLPAADLRALALSGAAGLESVRFSYNEGQPVLKDLSMRLDPGTTTALVGANGSGKSTVVSLLYGFYRPQGGRVTAGGVPYDDLDLRDLRRSLGWVPQDAFLFPGTIEENISYGTPGVSREEILQAATMATAHDFICGLENGYQTQVGEEGVLLSGGQRQRIAIARALVRRPRLLILDEPDSHLDHASIAALMEQLKDLPLQPAILLISHHPAIISHATAVYQLVDGVATATGPLRGGAAHP